MPQTKLPKQNNNKQNLLLRFVCARESHQRPHSAFRRGRTHLELLWEFTSRIPPTPGLRSPPVVRGVVRFLACGGRQTTIHIATTIQTDTVQTKVQTFSANKSSDICVANHKFAFYNTNLCLKKQMQNAETRRYKKRICFAKHKFVFCITHLSFDQQEA